MSTGAPRVLVVGAGMGAGHLAVADELVRRLGERGAYGVRLDVLAAAGRAGDRLVNTYRTLLRRAPWLYGASMWAWAAWPRPFERLTASGAGPFERALREAVDDLQPDVVVSTYNLAAQCLGRLRARGEIDCRVTTVMTDAGAHPYWLSEHVDLVVAPTSDTATGLMQSGARQVQVAAPVLPPRPLPPSRAAAREALGLPADERLALVTGGSWAAGDVRGTVRDLAELEVMPVVLCGRDQRLFRSLDAKDGVRAVAWTDRVTELLAAADVVVDNAGGQTCWEALAADRPVVLRRTLPGHGHRNAASLARSGLASWPRTASGFAREVRYATFPAPAASVLFEAPDAVDAVLPAGVPS